MITDAENAAKLQMIGAQYSGADLLSGDTFQNLQAVYPGIHRRSKCWN